MNKLAAICVVGILTGCSTSSERPQTHIYLLEETPKEKVANSSSTAIAIRLATLPDYLNQNQLVMKQQSNKIAIANYHRWAEDLNQAITKLLIRQLNNRDFGYKFVSECQACPSARITINHFYPTESGDVLLEGHYSLSLKNEIEQNNFFFKTSLNQGGYDESVEKMRVLLGQLSQDIANTINMTNPE